MDDFELEETTEHNLDFLKVTNDALKSGEKLTTNDIDSAVRNATIKREIENDTMDITIDSNVSFTSEKNKKNNIKDVLNSSLNLFGRVNVEYIAKVMGQNPNQIVEKLKGEIYLNPERYIEGSFDGYELKEEYLSGNIYEKLKVAKLQNKIHDGIFKDNIRALENCSSEPISIDNIYVTLGSPWLPVKYVEEFIKYIVEAKGRVFVCHDELIGAWEILNKPEITKNCNFTRNNLTYGTSRLSALYIIEKMLNMQTISITDEEISSINKSGKQRLINEKETFLALEKEQRIRDEFDAFIRTDKSKKKIIEEIYHEKFGAIKKREFDGSFLSFPRMNSQITLYPYQKNAVARILFTKNTLLAHEVGAGKTYIMITAGMELKRMGISKKNIYVVPNNIISQWESAFYTLYNDIKLLKITPETFKPNDRQKVLAKIRDEEFDAILIAYSSFMMIPLSYDYKYRLRQNSILELENTIFTKPDVTCTLKRRLKKEKKDLADFSLDSENYTDGICFDDLKINTLFIDEAHNYKNVPFDTKSTNILGINSKGSPKCQDMFEKVRCVQYENGGRGVVFATGTPITNSVSDAYIMQLYLQNDLLHSLELISFDAWMGNFSELASGFEVDVDTSGFRIARRFSRFHNLPELTALLSLVSDFYKSTKNNALPNFNGYNDCMVNKSEYLEQYLKEISMRADEVRAHRVKRTEDNMLKITTDGRKAALDMRLIDEKFGFSTLSKVYKCAENIFDIYIKYAESKGTQLVFCDTSTPKIAFNAYDELKRILVQMGIPEDEIAFIHEADTETKKEKILEDMRQAKLRVLVGSTWKLGLGVNVQNHLIAIHHLDVPWRPADMVQREGRIIRPGNINEEVFIYRYITEGSFDAYSWQLLETKARFIDDLLRGSLIDRSGSDVGDTVLNYAEVKALAIGNPLIRERVETSNELTRLLMLKKRDEELKVELEMLKVELPNIIEEKAQELNRVIADYNHYLESKKEFTPEENRTMGKVIIDSLTLNEMKATETKLISFQGFDILLPSNMAKERPYVIVSGQNRYKIEMKNSDIGAIMRLENFFNGLNKTQEKLKETIERLNSKLNGISLEIATTNNYDEEINMLREKLKEIDDNLKIKEN